MSRSTHQAQSSTILADLASSVGHRGPGLSIHRLYTIAGQDPLLQVEYELRTSTIKNPDVSIESLMQLIPGPDFPTAGEIYGKTGILEMYTTGRGKFILRGKTNIEETKSGKIRIFISELPYQVNKAEFVKKIADLHRDKKIIGISDLRDESDRHGIRVVVEIGKKGKPKSILNNI